MAVSHRQEQMRTVIVSAAIAGVLAGVVLIGAVFAGGHTFGQRCRAQGSVEGSEAWQACVLALRSGAASERLATGNSGGN